MVFTKKYLLYILSIILTFSLIANVYIFTKRGNANVDLDNKINSYQEELAELKNENEVLNERLSLVQDNNSDEKNEETEGNKEDTQKKYDVKSEVENAINRFVEYTFNSNPDNYVDKKKLAKNYMTDNLFEIIFMADGVDEGAQKVKLETGKVEIYVNDENNEAIVFYSLDKEIIHSGYQETVDNYIKLRIIEENNQMKISEIEPLIMPEGGA